MADNEKVYQDLIHAIRCPVCQGQSIGESDTPMAKIMRAKVRELLDAGKSADEVRSYLAERFGNFVLFEPPKNTHTWFLWWGPYLFFAGAFLMWIVASRRNNTISDNKLDRTR